MTKYERSNGNVIPSQLHMWDSLPTQTAIKGIKKLCIPPLNSIDASDTIDFRIEERSKLMLSRVEVVAKIRVLTDTDEKPAANANVSTVPDLSGALWRNVNVSIDGASITQSFDNSYAMAHFFDTVIHTKSSSQHYMFQKEGILLDHVSTKAQSENTEYFPAAGNPVNCHVKMRAQRIAEGKEVTLISDLNISLFKQGRFILPNIPIDISLTNNESGFILLSAADNTHKVKFEKVYLQCTFYRPNDMILAEYDRKLLNNEPAIYHADQSILTFQNIPGGSTNPTFESLFSGELPYFFVVGVQDRAAFAKDRTKNPFPLHRFNRISLKIDGDDYFPKAVEFQNDEHGEMYHAFLDSIGYINSGDTLIGNFYKPHKLMGYDLTQDHTQNQTHLNLKRTGTVKLELTLDQPAVNQVLVILAYYDRVIEIRKDRKIRVG